MNKNKTVIVVLSVALVIAIAIILSLLPKDKNTVYTIAFNTDGGNKVASQQIEEGGKITKPVDPSKEGYEFLGWYLNGVYFDFETEVKENLKLDAKWKEIVIEEDNNDNDDENKDTENKVTKYVVTFDSEGGSSVSKQTIEEGKTAKEPKDPTKSGYTFKGWYLGSTKYNFSNKVTKNITLTAKWEKVEEQETPVTPEVKKYTVTFDPNGGTSVAKQTIEEGKTATKPKNPTRTGYTFLGWLLNGEKFDFSKSITSDIKLTADWKKNDVISYKIEKVSNSVMNQVRVFITLNGEKVAGTADVLNTQGETIKRDIPATGWLTFAGTVAELKNIKVK